ncbi:MULTISPECIES: flavodoxin family protein [unclassified Variovorax]|uniref:flavodoxin family protein n=1 Tax=unclassified Variovorax TaxID=663243 RepID=UPI00076C728D|nr:MULTISPECIES: flavodoxin family protein [unclassified Variovorax]KWT73284.1 hypothetical protein APY03_5899 [Variovorax sp. WDL1]PNG47184.1 hypothetical protein CHC06_07532 [Variovorax sp. B2]PNG48165.1 hypothetical protein CHC07_07336 [Variovorax sp. B4]VTV15063.1 Flavodoxin [Variovorax sp. WDL1]
MSKVLVVVYSRTGTSRRLAEQLCSRLGWQLAEIVEERPRSGILGVFRCVLDSLLRRRPAIRYDGPFPKNFDVVVLVSPIWLGRLAAPMRSFVTRRRDHLPDLAVISVAGGTGQFAVAAEIADLVGETPIVSTTFTAREIDDGTCAGRLQFFGAALNSAEATHAAARRHVHPPKMAATRST